MYRYGQYCPVARAAEIVADRWTVLIVRELLADINHFNELERGLPHISRALLVERLKRLERTGVLERRVLSHGKQTEYRLTAAGHELQKLIDTLGEWGARWSFGEPRPDELDPGILLWWMRRRVALHSIPQRRTVIEFNFRSARKQRFWMLLEPTEVSVCLKHPGFDVDVVVSADIIALYRVFNGHATLAETLHRKQVRLEGSPADLRAFPQWFTWSPMAYAMRAAMADRQKGGVAIKSSSPHNKRMIA
jgi:DNA-binding HxlR family transcriptional regulator